MVHQLYGNGEVTCKPRIFLSLLVVFVMIVITCNKLKKKEKKNTKIHVCKTKQNKLSSKVQGVSLLLKGTVREENLHYNAFAMDNCSLSYHVFPDLHSHYTQLLHTCVVLT